MTDDTVTISRKVYERLMDNSRFLDALMAAGVDNWEGYSEACGEVEDDEEDD